MASNRALHVLEGVALAESAAAAYPKAAELAVRRGMTCEQFIRALHRTNMSLYGGKRERRRAASREFYRQVQLARLVKR
ncbi:MAG TPA: hypothetical protein VF192_01085 [Longimicrobiales bacterium]